MRLATWRAVDEEGARRRRRSDDDTIRDKTQDNNTPSHHHQTPIYTHLHGAWACARSKAPLSLSLWALQLHVGCLNVLKQPISEEGEERRRMRSSAGG